MATEQPSTDRMIPESLVREFIGYLSGAVPELHRVEVPLLAKHWDDFKWTVGDRLSGEPAPATTDRVAPSFDAWWNDDAYGCLRYSDPVQFDRLRQAFNAGVAAARAAPEPGGVPIEVAGKLTVAIERGAYVLAQMMQAYERRIRSECTSQEQIDKRPWECAEYVAAASYLLTMFPQSSTTKPAAEPAAQDMVPRSRYEACNADWLAAKAAREALSVKSVAWIETLLAALRSAEARLDQPVFNNTEKAGNAAANILRADVASALSVIRTALKYEPPAQPETKEPKHG